MQIGFRPPPPTPEILVPKDFCLQPGLERKFLLRRTWGRGKNAPTAVSRSFTPLLSENQVFLVRIHFSYPESDGKSEEVGRGDRIGIPEAVSLKTETSPAPSSRALQSGDFPEKSPSRPQRGYWIKSLDTWVQELFPVASLELGSSRESTIPGGHSGSYVWACCSM